MKAVASYCYTGERVLVDGYYEPGFECVVQQFIENQQLGDEKGAAFAVTHKNQLVVDIWGGHRDKTRTKPWQKDSVCVLYSATKGLAAMVMLKLHELGKFDYDQTVASIWPDFGCRGKQDMTIRTLMNHRGGLTAIDHIFSLQDFLDPNQQEEISDILAQQTPLWGGTEEEPNIQGYHMTTYGMYVMQLYRRLTDEPFAEFFRTHIADPLEADVWVGAPESIDHRVVEVQGTSTWTRVTRMFHAMMLQGGSTESNLGWSFLQAGSISRRAIQNPSLGPLGAEAYNLPAVRRASLLWASGVGTARGLAKVYTPLANQGTMANGYQLFQPGTLEPIYKRQGWLGKPDAVLGKPVGWAQGFLKEEAGLFSPEESGFGHSGLGGVLGWADPDRHLSFGYVTNSPDWRVRSPRCLRLCKSVYVSLEKGNNPS